MAKVKIVYGPAGCGKTYRAVNDFYEASKKCDPLFPEKNCFLVVPEQLAVETEKKFFEKESKGLIGSEVISFARLVHRIVSDADASSGLPLTNTMRSMLLVKALSGIENDLAYFNTVSDRPSGVSRLTTTLTELEKYSVTPEMLKCASESSSESHPDDLLTSGKLSDLSMILEAYTAETKGYSDSSSLASKAIEIINSGKSCVEGASVFFDSFSGFTDVELKLISAIAERASDVTFYIFRDRENPVFSIPNRTFVTLSKMFGPGGFDAEAVELKQEKSRYLGEEMLYILAKNYAEQKPSGLPFDKYDNAIELVAAVDFYHELEKCAKRISEIVSEENGIFYSDIAVALPSVTDNYYIIDAVFKEYDIPCFIDAKVEYSGHRVVRLFDSFLKVLSGENVIDNLLLILKTGLYRRDVFKTDDVDSFENLILKYACNRKQSFESLKRLIDFSMKKYDSPEDAPGSLKLACDIYNTFKGENGLSVAAKAAKTVDDVLDLISRFSAVCGLKDVSDVTDISEGGSRDDRDFIRVRNAFINLLQECSFAVGSVKKRGYQKLIKFTGELLMSASASIRAASIPFSGDYVQVGDLERSGYVDKKVMMVLGANAGSFPGNIPDSSFLGDEERAAIESIGGRTAYNSVDRALLLQFNVYNVLTCPRNKLYISWSLADEKGEELAPASAVLAIKKIFEHLKTEKYVPEFTQTENIQAIEGASGTVLSKDIANKILGIERNNMNVKVTALDEILKCPYKFLLRSRLEITERDIGDFLANTSGTYIHGLLEGAVREAISEGKLGSTDKDLWDEYIDAADMKFRENPENESCVRNIENSEKSRVLAELTKASAKRELMNLARLYREDGREPVCLELKFGDFGGLIPPVTVDVNGVEVRIRGTIDRVDAKLEGESLKLAVTDYKTENYDIAKVKDGKSLQLPVYSLALESDKAKELIKEMLRSKGVDIGDISVDALRYYLYGGQLSKGPESHKYASLEGDAMAELVKKPEIGDSQTVTNIKNSVQGVIDGAFPTLDPSDTENKKYCKSCSYRNFCKIRNGEED